jgi:hypothetical protein
MRGTPRLAAIRAALALAAGFGAGGCVPALVADAVSVGTTGKSVGEHALGAVSDKDCRILEGIGREDRKICEEPGSPATERDFKGLGKERPSQQPSGR